LAFPHMGRRVSFLALIKGGGKKREREKDCLLGGGGNPGLLFCRRGGKGRISNFIPQTQRKRRGGGERGVTIKKKVLPAPTAFGLQGEGGKVPFLIMKEGEKGGGGEKEVNILQEGENQFVESEFHSVRGKKRGKM